MVLPGRNLAHISGCGGHLFALVFVLAECTVEFLYDPANNIPLNQSVVRAALGPFLNVV